MGLVGFKPENREWKGYLGILLNKAMADVTQNNYSSLSQNISQDHTLTQQTFHRHIVHARLKNKKTVCTGRK